MVALRREDLDDAFGRLPELPSLDKTADHIDKLVLKTDELEKNIKRSLSGIIRIKTKEVEWLQGAFDESERALLPVRLRFHEEALKLVSERQANAETMRRQVAEQIASIERLLGRLRPGQRRLVRKTLARGERTVVRYLEAISAHARFEQETVQKLAQFIENPGWHISPPDPWPPEG